MATSGRPFWIYAGHIRTQHCILLHIPGGYGASRVVPCKWILQSRSASAGSGSTNSPVLPLHSFNFLLWEGNLSFCIAVLLLLQQPTQSLANFLKRTSVPVTELCAVAGSMPQVSLLKILSLSVLVLHLRRASLMTRPEYRASAGLAKLPNTFLKASSPSPSHRGPPVFRAFK